MRGRREGVRADEERDRDREERSEEGLMYL